MLKFHKITWKNFLSTGAKGTTLQLDKASSTLITGLNGSGKSTILDALCFALFGKPHRNINRGQLINSINGKDCVVEIEFSINSKEIKIIRGLRPNVFQIYENDRLIPQPSTVRDYQKLLEQNILNLNYRTFNQVVVLGSTSFIPFMQLSSGNRRNIIEDLLDINIFTIMNQQLRHKNSVVKNEYKDSEYKVNLAFEKSKIQQTYIKNLETLNDDMISKSKDKIETTKQEGIELQLTVDKLEEKTKAGRAKYVQLNKSYKEKRRNLSSEITRLNSEMKTADKQLTFFIDNMVCTACEQDIEHEHKEKILPGLKERKELLDDLRIGFEEELQTLDSDIDTLEQIDKNISEDEKTLINDKQKLKSLFALIKQFQKDIQEIRAKNENINKAKQELQSIKSDISHYQNEKAELGQQLEINQIMMEMLKDSGIKTKIIKQYIEPLNNIINGYLQTLDFFVSFYLDENFNETIKSRHRDPFTYDSFSEGEKQRIDLAILFAFRQIAKMKNSVNCNLLFLDETFDSSLDADGIDNLLTILDTLDADTNVFVISHKGHLLAEKFHDGMVFEKQNGFSEMRIN